MKVLNMTSANGNKVANQFIITDEDHEEQGSRVGCVYFQSYDSIIVMNIGIDIHIQTMLDRNTWDYSVTTGKYRNQFLGETKKETQAKIDSGEYILTDLN